MPLPPDPAILEEPPQPVTPTVTDEPDSVSAAIVSVLVCVYVYVAMMTW